jgi:hypothetical protein
VMGRIGASAWDACWTFIGGRLRLSTRKIIR